MFARIFLLFVTFSTFFFLAFKVIGRIRTLKLGQLVELVWCVILVAASTMMACGVIALILSFEH